MIPLRIKVIGFMSYRDEAEVTFDGVGLWMLAGHNGAGKSALFDAITYALYGRHRLGKSNHKGLINQQADALSVEYEFAMRDDVYCVKRTLSRKGNSSRQVLHIKGPSAPAPSRHGPQAVPETDTQAGFDTWVQQTIGLSYETFTASVLLLQGKSDALLEAEPRDRHDMLSQIVELSRYEQLHEAAEARHKQCRAQADTYRDQLDSMEPVDDIRLTELPGLITEAELAVSAAQQQLEHLAGLKVHAGRWNKLETERGEIETELEKSQELFARAEQIERDAARLAELNLVVPLLCALAEECERMEKAERHIGELLDDTSALETQLTTAAEAREEKRRVWNNLKNHKEELERQREEAQETLERLAPDMDVIREIDRLRTQIEELDQKLDVYGPDLDDRITRLQAEVSDLTELATALPWLRQYVDARVQWRGGQRQEEEVQATLARIAQSIPAELVAGGITTAAGYAEHAQSEVIRLTTLLGQEEHRLAQLDDLEGKPTCPYCGQPLAPDHIEAERERARQVIHDTRTQLDQARKTKTEAAKLKKNEETCQETLRSARQSTAHAEHQGVLALQNTPGAYRGLAEPFVGAGLGECFAQDYPTTTELDALGAQSEQLEGRKQEFKQAQGAAKKRDELRAQRIPIATRLGELESKYPDELITTVRGHHQTASDHLKKARGSLSDLARPLRDAEDQLNAAEETYNTTDSTLRETHTQLQQESARRDEMRRVVAEKRATIPQRWQSACDDLTNDRLATWENETASLIGADTWRDELMEARRQEITRQERLQHIERDQSDIPEEAHCPVANLEQKEQEVRQQTDKFAWDLKEADAEKRALETRRAQKAEWTDNYKKATRREYLYKELARLLGRDYLQRHLLQQAERGIVANANEVLDRISGGTLRLELRRDESGDEEATGQGATKALDLVAYNSETGMSPLSVRALSGSQKFRVSVGLALGIGYWAGQGAQRIETVIIDEGFGSLDQQGRRDMIDELHSLKSVLQRIIVVSHQEEFFKDFARGSLIELVDGTSTVKDLETAAGGTLVA
jgi:DNA repair exonuclease SbcCD ATPase subunit